MSVQLIFNHIEHHAQHSGYDQLAKYVDGKPYDYGIVFRMVKKLPEKYLEKFDAWHTDWYWGDAMPREFEMIARMWLPRRQLFHIFYAENDLRLTSKARVRWNNRIVASFHQPPDFLDNHLEDKAAIRGLDGAVVMSRFQVPYMQRFLPLDRIHVVWHGVDTEYWHPDPTVTRHDEPTFLFVGQWLRDIEMAKDTIRLCAERGLPARFRIVTFPDKMVEFEGLPNTTVMTGIPDEQLLEENRRAWGFFLPLDQSTANNAILEAMACGTAIVTTRLGGIPEYVSDDAGFLVPSKDIAAAADAIAKICESRELAEKLGKAAREDALKFSWPKMGALQNSVYEKVLKNPPRRRAARGR